MRACACLSARGSGETRFGLHFAPHRPRAEFLRYPGSGGLRGATRPAPRHPPRSLSTATPPRSGHRAAADAGALPTRVRVGGLRRRTARVGSARPSAMAGFPTTTYARMSALDPAPLCSEGQGHRESERWCGKESSVSSPHTPISIQATPKPREENYLNKNPVARQRPLPDKSRGSGSNQRAALPAPPA